MITRACLRSAAMIMMVPTSPGPRNGRQSLNAARNTAITLRTNDLPPLRPMQSQASYEGFAGGVLRPVCVRYVSS